MIDLDAIEARYARILASGDSSPKTPAETEQLHRDCVSVVSATPALVAEVKQLREALAGLVASLPRCSFGGCDRHATRYWSHHRDGLVHWCIDHGACDQRLPHAPALRTALRVLGGANIVAEKQKAGGE